MSGPPAPRFSVIVPTYNRAAQLVRCLHALAGQTIDMTAYELLVVNDGGSLPDWALASAGRDGFTLRRLDVPHGGPAAARNAGARAAEGMVLAFTDDDCMPEPDWLEQLACAFDRWPDSIIGGRTINALDVNPYSSASQLMQDAVYAHFNRIPSDALTFASNNLAVPRGRFWEIGGFDVRFRIAAQEDRDFCERWRERGWPLRYQREAIVEHAHPLTLGSFLRQHFTYGRGAFTYHQSRRGRGGGPIRPDPGYYAGLLAAPWAGSRGARAWVLEALVIAGVIANTVGHFYERWRRPDPAAPAA